MPIKFKCPNPSCRKPLSVKDQLAGKKAACPACKQVLTIPAAPTASAPPRPTTAAVAETATAPAAPADAEALAASFLSDEPKAAPTEEPRTIDFNCPYCDEALHLDAELAGQTIPLPRVSPHHQGAAADQAAEDRLAQHGLRHPDRRPPRYRAGTRGGLGIDQQDYRQWRRPRGSRRPAVAAARTGDGRPLDSARHHRRLQRGRAGDWHSVDRVVAWRQAPGEDARQGNGRPLGQGTQGDGRGGAVIHLAAGQFHLRRNEKDSIKPDKGDRGAWNQFGAARNRLAAAGTPECDALLIELALAQLDMAGSPAEVAEGKRMNWPDAVKEAGQTLLAVREPQQRDEGQRLLTRKLIAKGQAALARDLARQLGGGTEQFAILGLEDIRAGQKEDAEKLLEEIRPRLKPGKDAKGKPLPPPLSADVVTLLVALGHDKEVPAPKETALKEVVKVGKAAGLAWRGPPGEASKLVARSDSRVRLEALVAAADAPGEESHVKPLAEEAVGLAETKFGDTPLPGWLMTRLVREGLHAGVSEDRLLKLAQKLAPDDKMRGWVQLPIFRARLAATEGKADEALLDLVAKGTLANDEARVELTRHNTLKDASTEKAVEGWDESLRPFGYAGVALGLQGGS